MNYILQTLHLLLLFVAVPLLGVAQNTKIEGANRFGLATPFLPYQHQFQALSVVLEKAPLQGQTQWEKQGTSVTLTYSAPAGFVGSDTFELRVQESGPGYPYAFYRYIIQVADQHVIATDDYFSVLGTNTTKLPVVENDLSTAGNTPLTLTEILFAQHGGANITNNQIDFTPEANFAGRAFIQYKVCDATEHCKTAWAYIRTDNAIESKKEKWFTSRNAPIVFDVPTGFVVENTASEGDLVQIAASAYEYTPNQEFVGNDRISFYQTQNGNIIRHSVQIEIINVPFKTLYAQPDYAYTAVGQSLVVQPLQNDIGGLQIDNLNAGQSSGNFSLPNPTTLLFEPTPDFKGQAIVNYHAVINNLPIGPFMPNEWTETNLMVSNQLPNADNFRLSVQAQRDNIIGFSNTIKPYTLEILTQPAQGDLIWYAGQQTVPFNGGSLVGHNQLIYTQTGTSTTDQALLKYCVGFDCHTFTLQFDIKTEFQELATPLPNFVWPGDANVDGTVNQIDLLAIGQAFGTLGASRSLATSDFIGQPATNWNQNQPLTRTGYQHADTDGNGKIDKEDLSQIKTHFGAQYAVTTADRYFNKEIPFQVEIANAFPKPLDTVVLYIKLGSALMPAKNIQGLAFTMKSGGKWIQANSIEFKIETDSYFADAPTATYARASSNILNAAFTRLNQKPASGYGTVATVKFIVDDIIDGFKNGEGEAPISTIELDFEQLHFSDAIGQIFTASPQHISIPLQLDMLSPTFIPLQEALRLWPNPSSSILLAQLEGNQQIRGYRILDPLGRVCKEIYGLSQVHQLNIDHQLPNGNYLLQIYTDGGTATKPFIVLY